MKIRLMKFKKWQIIVFAILSIIQLSCNSNTKDEIRNKFNQLKQDVKEPNIENIIESLDQESNNYLEQVINMSSEENYEEASKIGETNNCELITLLLHEQTRMLKTSLTDSTETKILDKGNVVFIGGLTGIGILRFYDINRIEFKDFEKVRRNSAIINVKIALGDRKHFILSKYTFNKEDEEWKLNLLSTFKFNENLLNQQQRKSRKSKIDFIKEYVKNQPTDVEFMYRTKK